MPRIQSRVETGAYYGCTPYECCPDGELPGERKGFFLRCLFRIPLLHSKEILFLCGV